MTFQPTDESGHPLDPHTVEALARFQGTTPNGHPATVELLEPDKLWRVEKTNKLHQHVPLGHVEKTGDYYVAVPASVGTAMGGTSQPSLLDALGGLLSGE